ncbi:Ganglioside-induced differentiation-associated protein 2 [Liparis tanakae]|uniref:Ganglioside-induced differentiation-associated protein 2 n=1 Tax=Liparis tanakae TaxID=230148 RepID=A0A4Z2GDF9_9TELE|nr:Ganglioside-induced differentiation-associated protein 2 [Liparis tanakae]
MTSGVDMCGRTVVVLVGRNIPVTLIDIEKALLYFIHVMDHIAVKEYVPMWSLLAPMDRDLQLPPRGKRLGNKESTPPVLSSWFLGGGGWIGLGLFLTSGPFKKNLKAFYFVHPTFRSKVSTWFFTTFSVSGLKDKVRYLDTLQQLFTCMRPEQVDIPPFVLDYDAQRPYGGYQRHHARAASQRRKAADILFLSNKHNGPVSEEEEDFSRFQPAGHQHATGTPSLSPPNSLLCSSGAGFQEMFSGCRLFSSNNNVAPRSTVC